MVRNLESRVTTPSDKLFDFYQNELDDDTKRGLEQYNSDGDPRFMQSIQQLYNIRHPPQRPTSSPKTSKAKSWAFSGAKVAGGLVLLASTGYYLG